MAKPRKNEGPIEAALRSQGFVLLREACDSTGLLSSTVSGHIEAKRIKAEVLNGCYWVKPEDVQALVPVVEDNRRKQKRIFSPGGGHYALEEMRGKDDSQRELPTVPMPDIEVIEMAVRRVLAEQAQLIKELVKEAVREALS